MKTLEKRIADEYQKASGVGAIVHAVNCGKLLCQAKARCKRGEWSPWLASHWSASVRVANDYMRLSVAVANGSIGEWETLSIDEALRSIRSRQRKPQQAVITIEAPESPTAIETPEVKLTNQIGWLSAKAGDVVETLHRFIDGSIDGMPIKTEWKDARELIIAALRNSSAIGSGKTSVKRQSDQVTFISKNVMSGKSGLGERTSWKDKGLRVTVSIEIVD